MVSGFDKYFQLAHCFRDEDPRGDRQPEHTQIDMEMSFVDQEDVFHLIEGLMAHIFSTTMNIQLRTPFLRLAYDEAMDRFGSDKPDLRFDLEMQDGAFMGQDTDFKVFSSTLESGGAIRALVVPDQAGYSRKQISELEDVAKTYHAKGLAWLKITEVGPGVEESGLDGGIAKFFTAKRQEIITTLSAKPGDLVLFVADKKPVANTALGAVRSRLGKDLGLAEQGTFKFAWIVDFPLFEWNEDENKWDAAHHMFTMPQARFLDTMESDPGAVKGNLYDLVCNGYELASGSIRIHIPELQKRIFNIVGFPEEEAQRRFGFLLDAFRYGAPPHGGIAPGLDRLLMIMTGESTIREVMAFPKNSAGISPMDDSPSGIDESQLKELGLGYLAAQED
jgi:aspartyl-tRNA synthetase